jgi:DNA primase
MTNKTNADNWIDFKELKQRVTMEMVLKHYGLWEKLKKSGSNLVSCCPIHKGSNSRQFSVDPEKNIFNCFGNCKSGGNVLDFVSKMEGISIREAGLFLKGRFLSQPIKQDRKKSNTKVAEEAKKSDTTPLARQRHDKTVNPPLNFKLKSLKTDHPFFAERKISPDTVEYFGLGLCTRGILKNRIAIPIHNEKAELVAYCGRAVDDREIKKTGKYKLPKNFVKSAVVYNLHRQKKNESTYILVESFLSVFHLHQHGLGNVLALMGSRLSKEQEELIIGYSAPNAKIILMFDADASGQECTDYCLKRLGRRVFIRAIDLGPYAPKPHHLTFEQINALI